MESDDDFPFESIDQFEEAIKKYEGKEKVFFAQVPPLGGKETFQCKKIPTWTDFVAKDTEAGTKSPQSRTIHMIKEVQNSVQELEDRLMLRIEQIETLYHYLYNIVNKT